MGITEEDLREVREFMPGRTSKKCYGTGFGLPIARKNLLAHRGTIDIDSWDYKGTKVTITIPREAIEGDDE
jgi:signal transduction histidine kinase